MKSGMQRAATLVLASMVVACFALPASLSFARHRQLKGGPRRSICEPFVAKAPFRAARAGDTLWSLTEEMTGKPWVWPRVWAMNPSMGNPHQLMVGQIVHFVREPDGQPAHVSSHVPVAGPLAAAEPAVPQAEVGDEGYDEGDEPADEEGASPQPVRPAAPAAPAVARRKSRLLPEEPASRPAPAEPAPALLPAGLFEREQWRQFGTVAASTQEGLVGGVGERLRIVWPGAAPAGPWVLLRAPEGRQTADDGHRQGLLATVTGRASALPAGGPWQARVEATREGVEVGQRVAPAAWLVPHAGPPHVGLTRVCGHLVAQEHAALAGNPLHLIFVDRGSRDGLEAGSVLLGEGVGPGKEARPLLRVVHLGTRTATLVAIKSEYEFVHGQTLCTASTEDVADPALARWMR